MVEQMRRSRRREILSKRRQAHVPGEFQEGDIQYFDQEYFDCLDRPRTSDLESFCKTQRRPLSNT